MHADVRSRNREVWRWRSDASAGGADGYFGGDPADPASYAWTTAAPSVTAVMDLQPVERSKRALVALRQVRPDAAVLVLSKDAADIDGPDDGTLAREGELRDVLRVDLEDELERLEAERRAFCLRRFAEGSDIVPIVIHPDPDPDAVSSAIGIAALLGGTPESTPIVTLREMTRPENKRMAELLRIRVTTVTIDELRQFDRVICLDWNPADLQQDGKPRVAVIDHHPVDEGAAAEISDVRPEYGATATMVTEYLRAVTEDGLSGGLATALLFGIKTDTDALMRGVSAADVAAYAFLQQHADLNLIRRFEKPSYAVDTVRTFGRALADAQCEDDLCVTWLGRLREDEAHMLADVADFLLGVENVTWVAVGSQLDEDLVITLRHAGQGEGAGAVARRLAGETGSGGGHATMARATIPAHAATDVLASDDPCTQLRRLAADAIESVSRPASRPAHPV